MERSKAVSQKKTPNELIYATKTREPNEKKLIEEKQKIAAIKTFPVKTHIGLIFLLKVLVPFNSFAIFAICHSIVQSSE